MFTGAVQNRCFDYFSQNYQKAPVIKLLKEVFYNLVQLCLEYAILEASITDYRINNSEIFVASLESGDLISIFLLFLLFLKNMLTS